MNVPAWNTQQFGCLTRDNSRVRSLLRTALTATLPLPMVSRKADTSAPLLLDFAIDVDEAGWRAWQQWVTYDLFDGVLPFTIFLPWGEGQPRVRAHLLGDWSAERIDQLRWNISGQMELERESLPRFSGGALA